MRWRAHNQNGFADRFLSTEIGIHRFAQQRLTKSCVALLPEHKLSLASFHEVSTVWHNER